MDLFLIIWIEIKKSNWPNILVPGKKIFLEQLFWNNFFSGRMFQQAVSTANRQATTKE